MRLDVPYIRQPSDSMWCGVSVAAMILKYYGCNISQKAVSREMPVTRCGVSEGRFAQYFLRRGFDVTVQFWLPGLEPRFLGSRGTKDSLPVMDALQRGARQRRHHPTRETCKEMLVFMKRGGTVNLRPPFLRDIEKEISHKHPVVLCIDSNWLNATRRTQAGHWVVVTGFNDDGQVTRPVASIHDPDQHANRLCYFDELLYACHIWYGTAVFIRPRS
jgi:hypothetical protein